MPTRRRTPAGFTLIELMITVAIIAVVATAASVSLIRARPRANLSGAAVDLQALLHGARQQALVTGNDVAVMIFPGCAPSADVLGRVLVYEDGDHTLFDDKADVNLDTYDCKVLAHGPKSEISTSLDLPPGIQIGPATGFGAGAVLPAPLAAVPVNLDCTFCDGEKEARRGAVVFDSRGRARFHAATGAPLAVDGGSFSLEAPALGAGGQGQVKTLAIVGSTGAVRVVERG